VRLLITLVLPLALQIVAYVVVFAAARGGGSFMGLLAMPVAAVALIVLLAHGISAAKRQGPLLPPALVSLAIAVLPPMGLLIFRALER
jgi:hypothetical protein